jgi:enterochelin esterase-like enzyme
VFTAKQHLKISHSSFRNYSSSLQRYVLIEIVDVGYKAGNTRPLLILNDGQDLNKLLPEFTTSGSSEDHLPLTIVAVHAGSRIEEYGVSGNPDYKGRGAKADKYEKFIISELLPWLEVFATGSYTGSKTAFAGCSLGGLSALDIATSNPGYFSSAAVFSGSLWWRSKGYEDGYTENDRIIFQKFKNFKFKTGFQCWLMAGTNDEKNDRNGNGIIDSVDDTLDLYDMLSANPCLDKNNIHLNIVNGGKHDHKTWAIHLPAFLHEFTVSS